MPDAMHTLFDRLYADRPVETLNEAEEDESEGVVDLPQSGWGAAARGACNRCPRCGQAKLFHRFLKPALLCQYCKQDWSHQQADDFPAYVSIFLTGHILAPVIIALVKDANLSVGTLAAIIMPVAIIMMIALLQPAKGAIIAVQWWFGMHGFKRERREAEHS